MAGRKHFGTKKITSIILCMLMIFSLVPFTANAAKAEATSISVKATKDLIYQVDGYFSSSYFAGEDYFIYTYIDAVELTIYYDDGTSRVARTNEVYQKVDFTDDQLSGTQWGIGTHTVTATYNGLETTFDIKVVENPIDRITASATKALIEDYSGYYSSDIFIYNIFNTKPIITVYYKNGTREILNIENFEVLDLIDISASKEAQKENPWEIGKHTATISYMNVQAEFEVEVIENPIDHIFVKATKSLSYGVDGSFIYYTDIDDSIQKYFDFDFYKCEPEVTVYYKDNTSKTLTEEEIENETYIYQYDDSDLTTGTHTFALEYTGVYATFGIKIVDNYFESVEISGNETLSITLTKTNGEKINLTPEGIDTYINYDQATERFFANLDFGDSDFEGVIFFDNALDMTKVSIEMFGIASNTLSSNSWAKMQLIAETLQQSCNFVGYMFGKPIDFSGEITEDNIDTLIHFAVDAVLSIDNSIISDEEVSLDKESSTLTFSLGLAKLTSILSKLFDITDVDLTKANCYNEETQTFTITYPNGYSPMIFNTNIKYSKGTWNVVSAYIDINYDEFEDIYDSIDFLALLKNNLNNCKLSTITLDKDCIIKSIKASDTLVGDANFDGVVNAADNMLLERHLAGWDDISSLFGSYNEDELTESAKELIAAVKDFYDALWVYMFDIDGNGKITAKDNILLTRYLAGWDVTITPRNTTAK